MLLPENCRGEIGAVLPKFLIQRTKDFEITQKVFFLKMKRKHILSRVVRIIRFQTLKISKAFLTNLIIQKRKPMLIQNQIVE